MLTGKVSSTDNQMMMMMMNKWFVYGAEGLHAMSNWVLLHLINKSSVLPIHRGAFKYI
jgi:hypothetical protein